MEAVKSKTCVWFPQITLMTQMTQMRPPKEDNTLLLHANPRNLRYQRNLREPTITK